MASPTVYAPLDPPADTDARYFSVAEFRAEQDVAEPAASDQQVEAMGALAAEVIERAAGVAFIPRRAVERLRLCVGQPVRLRHPLVRELEEVTVDGAAWSLDDIEGTLSVDGGWVTGLSTGRGVLAYTHGYDHPPLRIRRAAMILTRVWLLRGPVDDRATQIATDGATINLATPGVFGSLTGIPEVDAAIAAYEIRSYLS